MGRIHELTDRRTDDQIVRYKDGYEKSNLFFAKEIKRETWMLELPEAKAKSFGLGPRTFTRKGITQVGDRLGLYTFIFYQRNYSRHGFVSSRACECCLLVQEGGASFLHKRVLMIFIIQ